MRISLELARMAVVRAFASHQIVYSISARRRVFLTFLICVYFYVPLQARKL